MSLAWSLRNKNWKRVKPNKRQVSNLQLLNCSGKIKILSFVVRLYLLLFNNARFVWKVPNSHYFRSSLSFQIKQDLQNVWIEIKIFKWFILTSYKMLNSVYKYSVFKHCWIYIFFACISNCFLLVCFWNLLCHV